MIRLPLFAAICLGAIPQLCPGQTVQLPSFQQFGISTTVSVPDRGSANLGGVNRAASGGNQFGGLPGNRSAGAASSAAGMSISVQIHDFEAMDRALLDQAAALRGQAGSKTNGHVRDLPHEAAPPSVAEIRRQKAAQVPADTAKGYMRKAQIALREGNRGAARVYFQMAARRASGELRAEALAQYHSLSSNAPDVASARSR